MDKKRNKKKKQTPESKVNSLILRQILNQFLKEAEAKIKTFELELLDTNQDLTKLLEPGIDKKFDHKLEAIAVLAKHYPKLTIESIMAWRTENGRDTLKEVNEHQKNCYPNINPVELLGMINKRRQLIANFIMCRGLIAIINNLTSTLLNPDLGEKIEEMAFVQIKLYDTEEHHLKIPKYVNLESTLRMFSKLLGALSSIRFVTVTEKYMVRILSQFPKRSISREFISDRNAENNLELLLNSMKYLVLKLYPMESLEDTVDFLEKLSEPFEQTNSVKLRLAFCVLFEKLLSPIAKVAEAELNVPAWQKAIERIRPRVDRMLSTNQNLNVLIPLYTTLLTVSKREYFLKNWKQVIQTLQNILEDPNSPNKELAMISLCKVIWTYIFRCQEDQYTTVKKRFDWFIRILFPPRYNKDLIEIDYDIRTRGLYYIIVKDIEFGSNCLISLITPTGLLKNIRAGFNSVIGSYDNSLQEDKYPYAERLFICIRAYLLLLRDVEIDLLNEKSANHDETIIKSKNTHIVIEGNVELSPPCFPNCEISSDYSIKYLASIGGRKKSEINRSLSEEVVIRMGTCIRDTLKIINTRIGASLVALADKMEGKYFFQNHSIKPSNTVNRHQTSAHLEVGATLHAFTGVQLQMKNNLFQESEPKIYSKAQTDIDYLVLILDSIPRLIPSGVTKRKILEIISSFQMHFNTRVQDAAFGAFSRLSKIRELDSLNTDWILEGDDEKVFLSQRIFEYSWDMFGKVFFSRYEEIWHEIEKNHKDILRICNNAIVFLGFWFEDIKNSNFEVLQKDLEAIPNQIESRGYIFFVSGTPVFRKIGIEFFRIASEFRELLGKKGQYPISTTGTLKWTRLDGEHKLNSVQRLSTFQDIKKEKYCKKEFGGGFRIYDILTDKGPQLIRDNYFSSKFTKESEDSEIKARQKELMSMKDPISTLCTSEDPRDTEMWIRCLPKILQSIAQFADKDSIALGFESVWRFMKVMHPLVVKISNGKYFQKPKPNSWKNTKQNVPPEVIKQFLQLWKSRLAFIYTFIGSLNESSINIDSPGEPFKVQSVKELNRNYLQFLGSDNIEIRNSVIEAIGSIQLSGYYTVLIDLRPYINSVIRNIGSKKKNDASFDRIRTDLIHIISKLASFVTVESLRKNADLMSNMNEYIRSMIVFFHSPRVEFEQCHQAARYHFCVFIEAYYSELVGVVAKSEVETIDDYFPFKLRRDIFALFEGFCGYGIESETFERKESQKLMHVLLMVKDPVEKNILTKSFEEERKLLQLESVNAMTALLNGKLTRNDLHDNDQFKRKIKKKESLLQNYDFENFELSRVFGWIDALLRTNSNRYHFLAKLSIENILKQNKSYDALLENVIDNCYTLKNIGLTSAYFMGFVDLITKIQNPKNNDYYAEILTLSLFHMSSDSLILRKGAGRLLIAIDYNLMPSLETEFQGWYEDDENEFEEQYLSSKFENLDCIEDLKRSTAEISEITSTLPMVYKTASLDISKRWANEKDITKRIGQIYNQGGGDKIRDLLVTLPPWVARVKIDGDFHYSIGNEILGLTDKETLHSWTVINNLFYITLVCGDSYFDEIQQIWNSLLNNIDFIARHRTIDCVIDIVLFIVMISQNSKALHTARLIMLYMCKSKNAKFVFNSLVFKLNPDSFTDFPYEKIIEIRKLKCIPSGLFQADLNNYFGRKDNSGIFVVPGNYIVSIIGTIIPQIDPKDLTPCVPLLLTLIFSLMDTDSVKSEEMRLLLIYLLQNLFQHSTSLKQRIDATISTLALRTGNRAWKKEQTIFVDEELDSVLQMEGLALEIFDLFNQTYPEIENQWAWTLLKWGTEASDIHIACRSIQLFRRIYKKPSLLYIHTIANSIKQSIKEKDFDELNYELLKSLGSFIDNLSGEQLISEYSSLFFIAYAFLECSNENHYAKALKMIESVLQKFDLTVDAPILCLLSHTPFLEFRGLLKSLFRGLKSSITEESALKIINMLLFLPVPLFLDIDDDRFIYVVIANLPRLLRLRFDEHDQRCDLEENPIMTNLLTQSAAKNNDSLLRLFTHFGNGRYNRPEDFLKSFVDILKEDYSDSEWNIIKFCLSLLSNPMEWYSKCLLILLEYLLKDLPPFLSDTTENMQFGDNWLSPLLLLIDGPYAAKACRVLDIMMSGSIKTSEQEISQIVGGSKYMNMFVTGIAEASPALFAPSGWLLGENNDIVAARLDVITSSVSRKLLLVEPKERSKTNRNSERTLISRFEELELHFRK